MDAYDFVITVLAFSPKYAEIARDRGRFGSKEFYKTIMECPEEFLKKIGIRPHPVHGDSHVLDEALYNLTKTILNQFIRGGDYVWDFPLTPKEYFEQRIKPNLKEGEFSEIEKIALSLN